MVAPLEAANPSGPRPEDLHHLTLSRPQSTPVHQPQLLSQLLLINPLLQHAFQSPHVPTYVRSQTALKKGMAPLRPLAVSQFRA